MNIKFLYAYVIALLAALVTTVSATVQSGTVGGTGLTMMGPLNLLVDLGIQNAPGVSLAMARVYYNWIAFALIIWITFFADERNSTQLCILATGIAAIVAWFGWFATTAPGGQWALVAICALLSATMYITEQKRINFGLGGGGSVVLNIVLFMILLQSVVGLLNSAAIFADGSTGVASFTECGGQQYGSCAINGNVVTADLAQQTGASNVLDTALDLAATLVFGAWNLMVLVIKIIMSIALFSVVLLQIYPWIGSSPVALLLVGVYQVVFWFLVSLEMLRWIAKPGLNEGKV